DLPGALGAEPRHLPVTQGLERVLHPAVAILLPENHESEAAGGQRILSRQMAGETVLVRVASAVMEVEHVISVVGIVRCPPETLPDRPWCAIDLVDGDLVPDRCAGSTIVAVGQIDLDRTR